MGVAVLSTTSSVSTITSSTFAKNTANDGGSIYNNANGASANSNIKYTTFLLNSASDGGAVYNDGDYGTLTLYSTNNILKRTTLVMVGQQ